MDPSKTRIGIIVVSGQQQQPPPPHLVPYLIRSAEDHQKYRIVVRSTIGMMSMTLFWVLLGFSAKVVLMAVLGSMLVDTALYGLVKWRSGQTLAQAIKKGPPE